MEYEVVIGLEVHVQLMTESKMFCSCVASYQDASPNTLVCPVCMGMPGVLPVINQQAVEYVIKTGLALDCTIARNTKFDRKNYPYPDLMKGYQVSQYDEPIASNGSLAIESDGRERVVGITRVHLEEDVAKLFHRTEEHGEGYSLLDINRSGVPLMEVVGDPEMHTPEEARSYLTRLRSILRYIGVSTANMEEGSFRCDANISVRPVGSTELGSKVEVKNMNSFRSVYGALQYETQRQVAAVDEGTRVVQETRGWVEDRGVTVSQRSKEYASDYRYFPEPDLPPLVIDPELVRIVRESLPELPLARKTRFVDQYGVPDHDADLLTSSIDVADFFESVVQLVPLTNGTEQKLAKSAGNWILGEMSRLFNQTGTGIAELKIEPQDLADLIGLVDDGTLSTSMARTVFEEMFHTGGSPKRIADDAGMSQISDTDSIAPAVDEVITGNPRPVSDYLGGKETAIRYLVGQVMKSTKGQANPKVVTAMLEKKLDAMR